MLNCIGHLIMIQRASKKFPIATLVSVFDVVTIWNVTFSLDIGARNYIFDYSILFL